MGCLGSCLRAVYHRMSPYLHRTARIHPGGKATLRGWSRIGQLSSNNTEQRVEVAFLGSSPGECLWSVIDKRIPQSPKQSRLSYGPTVYCYVVSTYDDFHSERQVLANEVFPEIKRWCDSTSLQFIPIDFYWRLGNEVKTSEFLKTSLFEMKRCLQVAGRMFIVVLVSETLGWVPSKAQLIEAGVDITKYPVGTSLFEILIAEGTFFADNTNALFMFRDSGFLGGLPRELLSNYRDFSASVTLQKMKSKIHQNFEDEVFSYSASAELSSIINDDRNRKYMLSLDGHFTSTVSEFILNKLQKQQRWSASSASIQSDYQEKELKKHASVEILGKDLLLQKINAYIENSDSNTPLVLVGEKGSGKSTVMARCIQLYCERERIERQARSKGGGASPKKTRPATSKKGSHREIVQQVSSRITSARVIKQPQTRRATQNAHSDTLPVSRSQNSSADDPTWYVFYHFITMFPRSADLRHILQRLWTIDTFSQPRTSPMSLNVNKLAKEVRDLLGKRSNKRTLIFINGIDQVLDERSSHVLRWLPVKLAPTVKVILSLGPKSEIRKVLTSRDPPTQEVSIGSLSLSMSRQLITQHLSPVSTALVDILLSKLGICNPLFACELVKYITRKASNITDDENQTDIARSLPDDLAKLCGRMVHEVEEGDVGRYCIAALCLLHCSHYGLQENELLELLSALSPSGFSSDDSEGASGSTSRNISCAGSAKTGSRGNRQRQSIGMEQSGLLGISSQGSPRSQPPSRTSLTDVDGRLTPQPLLQRRTSPTHSLTLPGATIEEKINPNQLSPRRGMAHSNSYPSANDLLAALPPAFPPTPEGSPVTPRALQYLNLPPSRASPSISLLSIDLGNTLLQARKQSSSTQHELEIVDLDQSESDSKKQASSSPKPLVGLERVTMLDQSDGFSLLPSYQFSQVLHKLIPLLRCIGRPGESRYCLANQAIASAVKQRYFRHPPTTTFPFSFCTSSSFFGADKDHTLMSLVSQVRRWSGPEDRQSHHSRMSTPTSLSTANTPLLQLDRVIQPIEVSKRYDWWHARLAGYFATCSSEERRSEELPYHLAKTQNYGQLSHCLVHLPLFERLCTDDNVMDLLFYWQCTGGYSSIVNMYQHALEAHEISGASNQEMVKLKHKIAVFLHQAGETEAAHQILVDAIEVEEDKLKGRLKTMASLTLTMTEFLSSVSKQQAEHMEPSQITEPEYRLLQFAGRSVEFHRSLEGIELQRNLAHLLMILSHHLQHYSTLGGSLELSSVSALEQAREAAQESTDIYLELRDYGHALDSYLQMASTYFTSAPSRAMEILREAESMCLAHYGANNNTMLNIIHQMAFLYRHHLHDEANATEAYDSWTKLNASIYGDAAAQALQTELHAIPAAETNNERDPNSLFSKATTEVIIEPN